MWTATGRYTMSNNRTLRPTSGLNETPGQPTKFSVDENFGDFIVHWSIAALKFFKENLMTNFGLIAVFVKLTFEITKRALSIAFHPD